MIRLNILGICKTGWAKMKISSVSNTGSYMQAEKNVGGVRLILEVDRKKCVLGYCQLSESSLNTITKNYNRHGRSEHQIRQGERW